VVIVAIGVGFRVNFCRIHVSSLRPKAVIADGYADISGFSSVSLLSNSSFSR
jgi:hypothetical protein